IDHAGHSAVAAVDADLVRRGEVAPAVDVARHRRIEDRGVLPRRLGEALLAAAVQLHPVDVETDRTAVRAGEVNVLTIGAVDLARLPLAAGDLPEQRAVGLVVVDVAV